MWILETPDAPAARFKHERFYLPPGRTVTFGRHSACLIYIHSEVDKTVSRVNTELCVAEPVEGTSKQLDVRSKVTITDKSKFGTIVNGDVFKQKEHAVCHVTESENLITCGKFDLEFRLYWQPMIFCIVKGSMKPEDEAELLRKCDKLDIKATHAFTDKTTHLVCKAVSTPKGLQALIKGIPVVSPAYISAIYDAREAMKVNMSNMPDPCSSDFYPEERAGGHSPQDCLPKQYNSAEAKSRAAIFRGLEFIFTCKDTFQKLSPVFLQGEGKCVLYDGPVKLESLAAYVQDFKKPVWVSPKDDETARVVLETSQRTCTEHILPSDVLDLILSDGSHAVFRAGKATTIMEPILSSPLEIFSSGAPAPPTMPASSQLQPPASSQAIPAAIETGGDDSPPPAKKRIRTNAFQQSAGSYKPKQAGESQSSFGFPVLKPRVVASAASQALVMPTLSRVDSSQQTKAAAFMTPRKRTLDDFWSQSRPSAISGTTNADGSPQRPPPKGQRLYEPTEEIEEAEEEAPIYAPAAKAFLQKRAAQRKEASTPEEPSEPADPPEATQVASQRKRKQVMPDITEEEVARSLETQREKTDQAAAQEAASNDEDEEVLPAPVTAFQVPATTSVPASTPMAHRGFWDPKWDGRPNYKLFRPKGEILSGDALRNYANTNVDILLVKADARQDAPGMRDLEWLEREERHYEEQEEEEEQTVSHTQKRNAFSAAPKRKDPLAFNFDFGESDMQRDEASDDDSGPARAQNDELFLADSDDEVQPRQSQLKRHEVIPESEDDEVQMLESIDDFVMDTATVRGTETQRRSTASTPQPAAKARKSGASIAASSSSSKRGMRASARVSPAVAKYKGPQLVQESIELSSDDEPADKLKFRF
jgi:hypothetical protein